MAGVYRQRHPERTVFYRVMFHYFEEFVSEYENRSEREYGYFRPVIKEVVEKYLDCGNRKCGFARIRCGDCGKEFLLHFSCKVRGFCPSCHAKRREEWSEWMPGEAGAGCSLPSSSLYHPQDAAYIFQVQKVPSIFPLPLWSASSLQISQSCHRKRACFWNDCRHPDLWRKNKFLYIIFGLFKNISTFYRFFSCFLLYLTFIFSLYINLKGVSKRNPNKN